MISAAICSLSADLNSLAAVGVEDYYKKFRKARPDGEYLWASRSIVLVSGILSILIGLIYVRAGDEGVLGTVFTLYAIFSGGIVGIFLLGLFSPRTNRQGVTIGIIVCVLFTAYAVLTSLHMNTNGREVLLLDLGSYNFGHDKLMLGVYSHLVLIGVGYLSSLLFPKPVIDPKLLYRGWAAGRKLAKDRQSI